MHHGFAIVVIISHIESIPKWKTEPSYLIVMISRSSLEKKKKKNMYSIPLIRLTNGIIEFKDRN